MMSPKARQTTYAIGTIATSIITLAALWRGISGEAATTLTTMVNALLGLLGATATATATVAVTRQQRNGAFDHLSPVEQAIKGIEATVQQVNTAATDYERVKAAASDVFKDIPVVGPLAQQVIDSVKIP